MNVVKPLHSHDCNCCRYLGMHIDEGGKRYDLWYCPREQSCIARYGTEANYISTPFTFAGKYDVMHPIYQCAQRVLALGMYRTVAHAV